MIKQMDSKKYIEILKLKLLPLMKKKKMLNEKLIFQKI